MYRTVLLHLTTVKYLQVICKKYKTQHKGFMWFDNVSNVPFIDERYVTVHLFKGFKGFIVTYTSTLQGNIFSLPYKYELVLKIKDEIIE